MGSLRLIFASILSLQGIAPLYAAVNDIQPGDYYPLPPDTNTLALYAYDRVQSGPYAQGRKLLDMQLGSSISVLRMTRTLRVADTTVSVVGVLPWAQTALSPSPPAPVFGSQAQGLADLRLGLAAWPVNDPARANYLGLSAMVIAPTGNYDSRQILNVGENRWRMVFGGGWQKDVTPKFIVELSPEVAFYGDNRDYAVGRNMSQRPTYALTGYLRYRMTSAWHLHIGAQANRGGDTYIDGIAQHNPTNNDRLMAGMTWFLPSGQQIILRVAHDTAIDNGFRTNREVTLRWLSTFSGRN